MTLVKSIKNLLDRLLEGLVMIVVAVLVVDVLWQVFTRFVIKKPSTWTEELAIFMLIWVSLLGAAVALGRGAHLGIDYFVGKLPERMRMGTEVFVFFCVSLFSLLVMLIGGVDLVRSTLEMGQESSALRVKVGYVYLAIPISGFFLTLYGVIGLVERLGALGQGRGATAEHVSASDAGID
jgi:TRAP-type C4-dicarboxylate transport system permease small subunit